MNDLCVASVFCNCPHKRFWFKKQYEFLKETTKNFDYVIVSHNCPPRIFDGSTHILKGSDDGDHQSGLKKIKNFFESQPYKYCLILDSDSFPINPGWFEKLQQHDIASVIRFENLDNFAHPSVIWLKKSSVNKIQFEFRDVNNLVNYKFKELVVEIKSKFFPLLRTNAWNPHPILCAIYYDCFYHHGAGSRRPWFRAINKANYYDRYQNPNNLFKTFSENTKQFIHDLRFGDLRLITKNTFGSIQML